MAFDITVSSSEIQKGIEDIVRRTNEQILYLNSLPPPLREQMNMRVYDDIEYLLRYITALHAVLDDVAVEEQKPFAF